MKEHMNMVDNPKNALCNYMEVQITVIWNASESSDRLIWQKPLGLFWYKNAVLLV